MDGAKELSTPCRRKLWRFGLFLNFPCHILVASSGYASDDAFYTSPVGRKRRHGGRWPRRSAYFFARLSLKRRTAG